MILNHIRKEIYAKTETLAYVAKKSKGRPRLSSLSLRDNKLILDSKELTGVKNYELKNLETTTRFSELKITLLVELV